MHGRSSEVSGTPMHVLDARYAWHSVVPARACMQPWGGEGLHMEPWARYSHRRAAKALPDPPPHAAGTCPHVRLPLLSCTMQPF